MWVTRLATFCPHVVPRKATKTTLFEILVFWEFGHRNTLFGGDRKVHQVKGRHSRFWGALTCLMSEITSLGRLSAGNSKFASTNIKKSENKFFKNQFFRCFHISFEMILRVKYMCLNMSKTHVGPVSDHI